MDSPENMMRQEISLRSSDKDEYDEWLIDNSYNAVFPQTKYQCVNYVAESNPTKYAAIRQSCLEIGARKHSLEKIKVSRRKEEIHIKQLTKQRDESDDPLEKEMIQCDIDLAWIDMKVWEKKMLQNEMEMRFFLDYVKEECGENEEEVRHYLNGDSNEEDKYWIARMAKQSAVDMLSSGTINQGNMESILQMPQEHQKLAFNAAMRFSGVVSTGIDQMRLNAESEIKYLDKDTGTRSRLLTDETESNQLRITDG